MLLVINTVIKELWLLIKIMVQKDRFNQLTSVVGSQLKQKITCMFLTKKNKDRRQVTFYK